MNQIQLIELFLKKHGTIILRNSGGTMELRGTDLACKTYEEWLTIFHTEAKSSESQSHLHLRFQTYGYAEVVEPPEHTPFLAFWPEEKDKTPDNKSPFAMFFPSFYDWGNNKQDISENQEFFKGWVSTHGRIFDLTISAHQK